MGSVGGSRDNDTGNNGKRAYIRFTSAQLDKLETFMKECDHPNVNQRNQLAEEVGLEPKQVKFWFQNKRALLKNQHEKEVNTNLRVENESIKSENLLLKQVQKVTLCSTCEGLPFPKENHEDFMHKMAKENDQLRKEYENVSKLLAMYMDQKISQSEFEHALNSIQAFRKLQIPPKPSLYGNSNHVHGLGNPAMMEVMQTIEGRKKVMDLSHRMVKIFYEYLSTTNHLEFQPLNVDDIIGGVKVSLSNRNDIGQPNGMVFVGATTIWLPLLAEKVFQFLKDPIERYQWDVLSYGNPMQEIKHISNETYHGNYTSILQPYIHEENNMLILQESFSSSMGSYVVYAPIDASSLSVAIMGEDSKNIQILPSGFLVCSKALPNTTFQAFNNIGSSSNGGGRVDGTLLTFAYQILTPSPHGIEYHQNMDIVANINTLVSITIMRVRNALMNSN